MYSSLGQWQLCCEYRGTTTLLGPRRLILRAVQAGAVWLVAVLFTTLLQVVVVRFVTPPWTLTMVAEAREAGTWPSRRVRRLAKLGEYGPRAIVASEDARFFLHQGFDNEAICSAVKDAMGGKRLRGASTITQQVAKNVFLSQSRSLPRKVVEAWYTFWLERFAPKDRILELYVNVAEMGPATFGLEAASRHHFNKPAASLDRSEAGRLAGILPNPARSVNGKAAWSRATWVANHPAPFPGDRYFDRIQAKWREDQHSLVGCFF